MSRGNESVMQVDEIARLVGVECGKVAEGVIDAMTIFGLLTVKASGCEGGAFIETIEAAADAFHAEGKLRAETILRAVARRMRSGL